MDDDVEPVDLKDSQLAAGIVNQDMIQDVSSEASNDAARSGQDPLENDPAESSDDARGLHHRTRLTGLGRQFQSVPHKA